jgi:uncharacterized membrane protein
MQVHRIVAYCAITLILLTVLTVHSANAQDYIEYKISVNQDNSATWRITQVSDVNAPIDTWENFQTKIYNLADNTEATTKRPMRIDDNSLQINTTISTTSKTTEYMFIWQNFSITEANEVTFGDVFSVNGFFTQLYGEASLQINYPPNFALKSVSPEPNSQDQNMGTLRWYRTQDLENTPTKIILASNQNDEASALIFQHPLILVGTSVAGLATLLAASFLVIKRKKHQTKPSVTVVPRIVESEEDKILNILRASNGSMRQSDITEQCRFSKAKTSQLLSALEKKGTVARLKSGRDKIVTLNNGVKGEKKK